MTTETRNSPTGLDEERAFALAAVRHWRDAWAHYIRSGDSVQAALAAQKYREHAIAYGLKA